MLSVVVPTMWKYTPFLDFLYNLVKLDVVGEVVIINNDVLATPAHKVLANKKITLLNCDTNIYVNPAWNLGVKVSKYNKICVINDDVTVDLKLFHKMNEFLTPDIGTVGIVAGDPNLGQPPFVNGSIDIVPWTGQFMYGFGNMFFIHKSNWIDIPSELKIYYGDNWVFDTQLFVNKKTNYMITNTFFHHEASFTTSKMVLPDFGEKEAYERMIDQIKNHAPLRQLQQHLEAEYNQYSQPSYRDFYLHMPRLRKLVSECQHVTEFGISEGQSTRALLVEPVTVRSYDLFVSYPVAVLFDLAQQAGRNVAAYQANVLETDIEPTDLLFLDSLHTHRQVSQELNRHASKVKKYLVFHDTFTFGLKGEGEDDDPGVLTAVMEFLAGHPEWRVKAHYIDCNGLTVLERIA